MNLSHILDNTDSENANVNSGSRNLPALAKLNSVIAGLNSVISGLNPNLYPNLNGGLNNSSAGSNSAYTIQVTESNNNSVIVISCPKDLNASMVLPSPCESDSYKLNQSPYQQPELGQKFSPYPIHSNSTFQRNSSDEISTTSESEKKFSCVECDSKFLRNHDLLRHIRSVHVAKKKFVCLSCDSCFSRKDAYRRHMRNAHG